jgi:hypothetical protein
MQPAGGSSWRVHVSLVDADSGRPTPGFEVAVVGTGPAGSSFDTVTLADPDSSGEYGGEVSAETGSWSVTVRARDVPGGEPAIPLTRTWRLDLSQGATAEGAGEAKSHNKGGPGAPDGILLACVAAAIAAMAWARRRQRVVA